MEQVRQISEATSPEYTFLVVDAMTGQDAVTVAESFNETLALDGVILTKLDGDARGGAALSVKEVVGKPIAFASTGEKLDDFEDRKSVVEGKSVSVRVDLGGRRIIKKKKKTQQPGY